MFHPASKSQKLLSTVSIVAVASMMLPLRAYSFDTSQYVQDYGKTKKDVQPPAADGPSSVPAATTTAPAKPAAKAASAAAAPKTISIVKATKHENPAAGKWNQFLDYIVLKPGQESLPLTLTVLNGSDGTKPLRAIRATLAGRDLFNERSFKQNQLTLDLTNAVGPGSTQIVFQAYGDKGASFTWDVSSKSSPTVSYLNPKMSPAGKSVKAVGKLLSSDVKSYSIQVGGKPATVKSASSESVEFVVPDGLKPDAKGEVPVQITVAGVKQKVLSLKLISEPEITNFSHISIASRQDMTITGKNFGTDASKVKVSFGGTDGDIISCSDTSIVVKTPEITEMPAKKEVTVEVNGLKCKKTGTILFSMRNVENDDGYSPFAIPSQFE